MLILGSFSRPWATEADTAWHMNLPAVGRSDSSSLIGWEGTRVAGDQELLSVGRSDLQRAAVARGRRLRRERAPSVSRLMRTQNSCAPALVVMGTRPSGRRIPEGSLRFPGAAVYETASHPVPQGRMSCGASNERGSARSCLSGACTVRMWGVRSIGASAEVLPGGTRASAAPTHRENPARRDSTIVSRFPEGLGREGGFVADVAAKAVSSRCSCEALANHVLDGAQSEPNP